MFQITKLGMETLRYTRWKDFNPRAIPEIFSLAGVKSTRVAEVWLTGTQCGLGYPIGPLPIGHINLIMGYRRSVECPFPIAIN